MYVTDPNYVVCDIKLIVSLHAMIFVIAILLFTSRRRSAGPPLSSIWSEISIQPAATALPNNISEGSNDIFVPMEALHRCLKSQLSYFELTLDLHTNS